VREGAKKEEDFPQNKVSQNKLDTTGEGGEMAHFGALPGFGLQEYSCACPICSPCTCSLQEGNFVSSDGTHEIGGAKGF